MIGPRPLVIRAARWGIALVGLGLVAMVVIHIPPVSGWLAAKGYRGEGFCPLGYGTAPSPANLEARRGTVPASVRPALGFDLDRSTTREIERWAAKHELACTTKYAGHVIECANVPASLVGGSLAATSVWFEIGARGTLRSIKTTRRDRDVENVTDAFAEADRELAPIGSAWQRTGSATPIALANGALRQAASEYRFTNYRAVIRATNMGDGFLLTEEYATLVD